MIGPIHRSTAKFGRVYGLEIATYVLGVLIAALALYGLGIGLQASGISVNFDRILLVAAVISLVGLVVFAPAKLHWSIERCAPRNIFVFFGLVLLMLVPILESFRLNYTNMFSLYGAAPFSDAQAYLNGAWRWLADGTLHEWNQRRPINATFMSVRLFLSCFNNYIFLAFNAVLVAAAMFYAASEVRRQTSLVATSFFVILMFAFVQPYIASAMSEVLGVCLGLVAFGALLTAARTGQQNLLIAGIAMLSCALSARAGCQLALPFVLIWAILYFGTSLRSKVIIALFGFCAAATGTLLSMFFVKYFGTGTALSLNSNFSEVIYGIARGGKGWILAQREHPELFKLPAAERSAALTKLAMEELWKNPWQFMVYCWSQITIAITYYASGPRLALENALPIPEPVVSAFAAILSAIGLVLISLRPLQRTNALVTAALLGIILSFPLIWQDGGQRVVTPLTPFIAWLGAVGAFGATKFFCTGKIIENVNDVSTSLGSGLDANESVIVPLIWLISISLLPLPLAGILNTRATMEKVKNLDCAEGQQLVDFGFEDVSWKVRVHSGDQRTYGIPTDLSLKQVQDSISYSPLSRLLKSYPAPYTVFSVFLRADGVPRQSYFMWPGQLINFSSGKRWRLCAQAVSVQRIGRKWGWPPMEVTKELSAAAPG